jgi:uncharacterized protein YndB with AHSA1/START domain
MTEVERTLVKSPPELWELVDDRALMVRWVGELTGGSESEPVEVSAREPGRRLCWRTGAGAVSIELELAERGWGTWVLIRAEGTGDEPEAGAVLERLLDELGSPSRRPFSRV